MEARDDLGHAALQAATLVRADVEDDGIRVDGVGDATGLDERGTALLQEVRVVRCEVDEVDRVAEEVPDASVVARVAERLDVRRRMVGWTPHARTLREDLHGVRADLCRALRDAREPAGGGDVCAEQHARTIGRRLDAAHGCADRYPAAMSVRVRFAPSPTGLLHVGGVRTALYNWLYARHHGGTAVLRIEDTDQGREAAGAIDQIQRSLDWLGLDFDESPGRGGPSGPYRQSERTERYRAAVDRLLDQGDAYRCYQTPEELEAARNAARETDDPASATRLHRELTAQQISDYEAAGRPAVIRFRVPLEGETVIEDLVRGRVAFEHRLLGDTVLMRGDGGPTYQLANPLDDLEMGITHVIRGEDLLPSTPRQRLLVEALGATFPATAHLAMILGPDKKRLSKRHGAANVEEFRAAGYSPDALVNYLALLGWSWDGESEIMDRDLLIQRFTIDRVNPAPAVFDHQKLAWMNGVYLRAMDVDAYATGLSAHLADADSPLATHPRLVEMVPLVQEKLSDFSGFDALAGPLLEARPIDSEAWASVAAAEDGAAILDRAITGLESLEPFDVEQVEAALRALCDDLELKPKRAFGPIRIAVCGTKVSPGLFEAIVFLGRDEALIRLRDARSRLSG